MEDEDGNDRTVVSQHRSPRANAATAGHFLAYAEGDEQRRLRIPPSGLAIGRTAPSDLVIPRPEISRRHCRIDIEGDWAVLTDLGATNGTFVDDAPVSRPTPLRNGNQISLGSYHIRYERRDPAQVAEEAELASEIRRAADYVRAILPPPITAWPVQAEWWFAPSSHLGGDAFGYQFLDETTFTGFLLDVSGHGIGSAMHAANVANVLRRRVLPGVDFHDPAQVAAGVNAVFPMEEHNDLLLSLWYFAYDLPTRRLRFCAAGHHASYLLAPETPPAPLWQRGPTIGMLPFGKWTNGEAEIPPDSRLFIFSDGAFEIITPDGREWTIEDLARVIAAPEHIGVAESQRLYHAVRAASRPGPLADDLSILVLRFG